ncbi:hypothetical protein CR3_gp158 [Cronobacter phage CR3]|uniref:Uncharacterized protein n=1 Tax=Cronobacter phage CR3 TaxID=1162295 RepID=I1TRK0_9CAUD|nr:hypothetical protein CR3_gp158 [Cronobacter phage CR3]AFH21323.1 hypothetical protein CR3_158 [Cronobacter phage CR3]
MPGKSYAFGCFVSNKGPPLSGPPARTGSACLRNYADKTRFYADENYYHLCLWALKRLDFMKVYTFK